MTDKEVKKLKRTDLLKLLIEAEKENEELRLQIEDLKQKIDLKTLTVESAGSIAEAALKLNEVFESAQRAADQYLYNIKERAEKNEQ